MTFGYLWALCYGKPVVFETDQIHVVLSHGPMILYYILIAPIYVPLILPFHAFYDNIHITWKVSKKIKDSEMFCKLENIIAFLILIIVVCTCSVL